MRAHKIGMFKHTYITYGKNADPYLPDDWYALRKKGRDEAFERRKAEYSNMVRKLKEIREQRTSPDDRKLEEEALMEKMDQYQRLEEKFWEAVSKRNEMYKRGQRKVQMIENRMQEHEDNMTRMIGKVFGPRADPWRTEEEEAQHRIERDRAFEERRAARDELSQKINELRETSYGVQLDRVLEHKALIKERKERVRLENEFLDAEFNRREVWAHEERRRVIQLREMEEAQRALAGDDSSDEEEIAAGVRRRIETLDMEEMYRKLKGLTPSRMARFENFNADASFAGETCTCCMEDVWEGRMEVVRFECRHFLCRECAATWFSAHNTCIICRRVFSNE